MSFCKVLLLGRLGADPELRHTQGGQPVASLRIATSESWTKDGQRQERTEWHSVVAWGATAENCAKFLSRGREVLVEGRLQSREYTDKDGVQKRVWEVVADRVVFVGGAGGGQGAQGGPSAAQGGSRGSGGGWGGGAPRGGDERGGKHAPAPSGEHGFDEESLPF